ncbi:NTP transferase domain-containing protein [Pseudoalteromonas luteoviolacea]|uniref:sugar phosphate nucleotidyltransferase n=1 Tax=Pseudoalteromonas luteoviolacea TaxID=43657 RepID=UPI001F24EEBC|nr:sugar phosphate nucleotidyltransferase [Pseudoalteromonas luteoviolacea]MCF6438206.1 NTP transferase domain-containing protein [Pseudoalteromonas luteoviolacea]
MDVVVLVGGRGTRLNSIVNTVPKPLAPVAGRPFFDIILHKLQHAFGQQLNLVFATGHLHQCFVDYANQHTHQVNISLSQELTPLGTGGAIRQALTYCKSESVLILNGDCYFDICYRAFVESIPKGEIISIASAYVNDISRYGALTFSDNNTVIDFKEKGQIGSGYINAGVYLVNKAHLLATTDMSAFSFEQYLMNFVKTTPLFAKRYNAEFIDIGTPEDFHKAQSLLKPLPRA